jgi:hypothetical protein
MRRSIRLDVQLGGEVGDGHAFRERDGARHRRRRCRLLLHHRRARALASRPGAMDRARWRTVTRRHPGTWRLGRPYGLRRQWTRSTGCRTGTWRQAAATRALHGPAGRAGRAGARPRRTAQISRWCLRCSRSCRNRRTHQQRPPRRCRRSLARARIFDTQTQCRRDHAGRVRRRSDRSRRRRRWRSGRRPCRLWHWLRSGWSFDGLWLWLGDLDRRLFLGSCRGSCRWRCHGLRSWRLGRNRFFGDRMALLCVVDDFNRRRYLSRDQHGLRRLRRGGRFLRHERLGALDESRRSQHRCSRLDRFLRLAVAGLLPLDGHRRVGERGVRRDIESALTRHPRDKLPRDDLFDRARRALHLDAVIALQQRHHFLARSVEELRDFIDPNSCHSVCFVD